MQQRLLVDRVRWIVGFFTLAAGCLVLLGDAARGQRNFEPVSTLGPVIEPRDLEFESSFANSYQTNPLRSPKRIQVDSPKWITPKSSQKPLQAQKPVPNSQLGGGPFAENLVEKIARKPTPKRPDSKNSDIKSKAQFQFARPHSGNAESGSRSYKPNNTQPGGPELIGPKGSGSTPETPEELRRQQMQLEANAQRLPSVASLPKKGAPSSPSGPFTHYADPQSSSKKAPAVGPTTTQPPTTAQTKPQITKNLPPLTRQQQILRTKIRRVLTHYYQRPMNTRDRSPWEILHAMLAYEVHSQVLQGGPHGKPITAVGWLCFNQPCKRRTLMYVNSGGEMRVKVGPALQGHHGQLLAMLAQSSIKKEYPIRIDKKEFTIADLVEMEKQTCYPRTELTFKLISLMHYLESDATWLNDQGMEWDIPRLIREEIRQPVRGAACGGTHRLAGLTLAYKTRIKRKEPVDGDYLRAKKFVQNYQRYAYRLQNSDGSFSTEWFRGRGHEEDVDRRLKTTGHILEWLLYASTDRELHSRQTFRAANYLANIMYQNRYRDWEAGPLGHAVHALLLYDRKVFGKYDQWNGELIASKRPNPEAKKSSKKRRQRK